MMDSTVETMKIITDGLGAVDERPMDDIVRISFTPSGKLTDVTVLITGPMGLHPGQSIYGASDLPLVIWPFYTPGKKLTLANVGVSKPPSLKLGAGQTLFGPAEFVTSGQTGVFWSDTDRLVLSAAFGAPTHNFLLSDHLSHAWNGAWGASPFDVMYSAEGWEITPTLNIEPVKIDITGTVDFRVVDGQVQVKGAPLGASITEVALINAQYGQGTGAVRGGSLQGLVSDLVITDSEIANAFTVTKAILTNVGLKWAAGAQKRIQQCTWQATRTVTTGVPQPLISLATP